MPKLNKILVTGGAGFIGSCLIRLWLEEDPSVSIVNLDKLTYCGDLSRLKDVQNHPRYSFIKGDICKTGDVRRAMAGCSAVVHVAAETHVDRSLLEGEAFFETNLNGTYLLLEEARRKHLGKFIFVSTDEVYGSRGQGFFKETDPLGPTSPYSVSKAAADLLAQSYAHTHGMHVVVTRGCNTFGPYQYPEKVIPLFVSNALSNKKLPLYGDGLQIRNWMHVDDHCRAIIHAYRKGEKGHVYNISSKTYLTNLELTQRILKILGKPQSLIQKVKDRQGHDRRYAMTSLRLRNLGWKEMEPFSRALRQTVTWYARHENWWRKIINKSRDFKEYYAKAYAERV